MTIAWNQVTEIQLTEDTRDGRLLNGGGQAASREEKKALMQIVMRYLKKAFARRRKRMKEIEIERSGNVESD